MYICRVGINEENIYAWKQPPRGVPMKRCSENTQHLQNIHAEVRF